MARKAATKKKSPKKSVRGKAPRGSKKTARRGGYDLRRLRELGGLAFIASGIFLGLVFYLGWSGGLVGEAFGRWLRYLLGAMIFLGPPALIVAGVCLIFPELPKGPRAFRAGAALCLFALFLVCGANTFSMLGAEPAHGQFFDSSYYADHGGLAGESLYWLTGSLIGDVGSTVAAVFLLAVSAFLLTGASVRAVLVSSGAGARRAAAGARKTARQLESSLAERRAMGQEPAVAGMATEATVGGRTAPAPFGVDPVAAAESTLAAEYSGLGDGESEAPLNGASSYPDIFNDEDQPLRLVENGVLAPEDATAGPPVAIATAIDEEKTMVLQEELFPRGQEPEAVYAVPRTDMLRKSGAQVENTSDHEDRVRRVLEDTLASFGIESQVIGTVSGPRVTRYEIKIAQGVKLSKVTALKNDLAMALATTEIRILAPIPGKSAVGVEVPNLRPNIVTLGDIYRDFPRSAGPLSVWLGKDISGKPIFADLAKMPHLLVAGTTGSGKTGCIDCLVSSILLRSTPDEVRMILIDPKRVELSHFEGIPHLLTPVVTVMKDAANALGNLVTEMESRYSQMQLAKTHNIDELNKIMRRRGQIPMPYILLVVDELADLIMVSPTAVEDAIIRLAQKSRAVGIHLVLATQRPSVDVITGMIKANVPSRISFAVSSQQDSRIILDTGGAESLLGQGDMLFSPLGSSKLQRIQGAFITKEEIQLLTDRCRSQRTPDYEMELLEGKAALNGDGLPADEDELLPEAMKLVVEMGTASVSVLQRRLRVGYTRAGRLIDMLERRGVISGYEGSKPRRVLMSEEELVRKLGTSASSLGSVAERFAEDYDAVAAETHDADDLL